MGTLEDRPSVGERYETAIGRGAPDADVILAAGMQRHQLGATLLRLQSEYDTIRGDLERAGDIAARGDVAARAARTAAGAAVVRRRTESEALTARCLILTHLKTLREARMELATYALVLAGRQRVVLANEIVARLVGRVLDVWLDPTCAQCDGTGWVGSGFEGKVPRQCDRCGGSGQRRDQMSHEPGERWFAFLLLGDVQREVARAAAGMRAKLRNT